MDPLTVMLRELGLGAAEVACGLGCALAAFDRGVLVGGAAELGAALRGAVPTTPAGAAATGGLCPCALARRLSPTTTAVITVITVVTRRLIGVTT
jgi:hypothetical protein